MGKIKTENTRQMRGKEEVRESTPWEEICKKMQHQDLERSGAQMETLELYKYSADHASWRSWWTHLIEFGTQAKENNIK